MLDIEIAYGTSAKQLLLAVRVPEGTTAREAVLQSRIGETFPEADLQHAPLGIFGKAVTDGTVLRNKDRVEIYRPLLIDPKEARRLRARHDREK